MIRFLLGLGEVNIQNTFPFWHPEGALVLSLRSRWRHADRVQSWRRSGIPGITTAREASFRALARNLTFRTKRENSGLYIKPDRHPDRREGSSRAIARVFWARVGICSKSYSFLAPSECMRSLLRRDDGTLAGSERHLFARQSPRRSGISGITT